jgi:hypothetical protein
MHHNICFKCSTLQKPGTWNSALHRAYCLCPFVFVPTPCAPVTVATIKPSTKCGMLQTHDRNVSTCACCRRAAYQRKMAFIASQGLYQNANAQADDDSDYRDRHLLSGHRFMTQIFSRKYIRDKTIVMKYDPFSRMRICDMNDRHSCEICPLTEYRFMTPMVATVMTYALFQNTGAWHEWQRLLLYICPLSEYR